MPTGYRTRKVDGWRPSVALTIRELHEQCFGDSAPQIDPSEGHWWLTYLGDEPVAFAGMIASPSWAETGYLYRVGVMPAHRGHGLQKRLVTVREACARRIGWTHTVTDTNKNTPSANSLIKRGYQLFEPAKPWAKTALYWKKEL